MKEQNLLVNKLMKNIEFEEGIDRLLAIMRALRDPEGGCPWDKKQTYSSVLPFTIEEVYEVAEAIEGGDFDSLKDELGDLLFQIIFYAQIADEESRFNFNDIVQGIIDKLIRRHPHVFAEVKVENEEQLNHAWEAAKLKEREQKQKQKTAQPLSLLDDIPKALPELKRATKIQKRVALHGFDWENVDQVWDKIEEESLEVKEAALTGEQSAIEDEIGDLLFATVNLARHYNVDADIALRRANLKFEKRFRELEKQCKKPVASYSLDELEKYWQQVKKILQN